MWANRHESSIRLAYGTNQVFKVYWLLKRRPSWRLCTGVTTQHSNRTNRDRLGASWFWLESLAEETSLSLRPATERQHVPVRKQQHVAQSKQQLPSEPVWYHKESTCPHNLNRPNVRNSPINFSLYFILLLIILVLCCFLFCCVSGFVAVLQVLLLRFWFCCCKSWFCYFFVLFCF